MRGGSGVGVGEVDPVWLGFHIALKGFFLFCPLQDRGFQGKAKGSHPKNVNPLAVAALAAAISCAAGNRTNQSSGSARTTRTPPFYGKSVFSVQSLPAGRSKAIDLA